MTCHTNSKPDAKVVWIPECARDRPDRPSQAHCLLEDSIANQRIKTPLGNNLHGAAEQLLQPSP